MYVIAYHVQLAVTRIASRGRRRNFIDFEAQTLRDSSHVNFPQPLAASQTVIRPNSEQGDGVGEEGIRDAMAGMDRFRKHISDVSTLCTLTGYTNGSNGSEQAALEEGRDTLTPECTHDQIGVDMQRSTHILGPTRSSGASSLASQLGKVPKAIKSWTLQNVFLALSMFLFLLVGLPISCLMHNDLFLDVGFLFTVWLTFTSAQTRTKQHISHGYHQYERTLTAVATLLNPVLWTSLFLVAYGLAKSGLRYQTASGVVAQFTTNNTISDIMGHHFEPSGPTTPNPSHFGRIPIGAGDIATSILNAGIVSWGLRLFEYRHKIISRGGVNVIITSLLASLLNVVLWPLLACKMGVRPASSDLSFAARSVTIALGGPAMKSLGGDTGVNVVGVVVNGICFQLVAGLFVGGVDLDGLADMWRKCRGLLLHDGVVWNGRWTTEGGGSDTTGPSRSSPNTDQGRPRAIAREERPRVDDLDGMEDMQYSSDTTRVDDPRSTGPLPPPQALGDQDIPLPVTDPIPRPETYFRSQADKINDNASEQDEPDEPDDIPTVAAGVTIGINAAAMGTAHLYEQNSHASPYSALAMTTFGVFTVLFSVRSPLTEWLIRMVDGG